MCVQSFITTCLNIVMAEDGSSGVDSGSDHSVAFKLDGCGHPKVNSVPPKFCSATIKLAALQIHLLGVKTPVVSELLTLNLAFVVLMEKNRCFFTLVKIYVILFACKLLSGKSQLYNYYRCRNEDVCLQKPLNLLMKVFGSLR